MLKDWQNARDKSKRIMATAAGMTNSVDKARVLSRGILLVKRR